MFEFLRMMGNYEQRKVDNFKADVKVGPIGLKGTQGLIKKDGLVVETYYSFRW